jgi:hypothetical protein
MATRTFSRLSTVNTWPEELRPRSVARKRACDRTWFGREHCRQLPIAEYETRDGVELHAWPPAAPTQPAAIRSCSAPRICSAVRSPGGRTSLAQAVPWLRANAKLDKLTGRDMNCIRYSYLWASHVRENRYSVVITRPRPYYNCQSSTVRIRDYGTYERGAALCPRADDLKNGFTAARGNAERLEHMCVLFPSRIPARVQLFSLSFKDISPQMAGRHSCYSRTWRWFSLAHYFRQWCGTSEQHASLLVV